MATNYLTQIQTGGVLYDIVDSAASAGLSALSSSVDSALSGKAALVHTHVAADVAISSGGSSIAAYMASDVRPADATKFLNGAGGWSVPAGTVAIGKALIDSAIGADQAANSGGLYGVELSGATYAGSWVQPSSFVTAQLVKSVLGATATSSTGKYLDEQGSWTAVDASVTKEKVDSAMGISDLTSSGFIYTPTASGTGAVGGWSTVAVSLVPYAYVSAGATVTTVKNGMDTLYDRILELEKVDSTLEDILSSRTAELESVGTVLSNTLGEHT